MPPSRPTSEPPCVLSLLLPLEASSSGTRLHETSPSASLGPGSCAAFPLSGTLRPAPLLFCPRGKQAVEIRCRKTSRLVLLGTSVHISRNLEQNEHNRSDLLLSHLINITDVPAQCDTTLAGARPSCYTALCVTVLGDLHRDLSPVLPGRKICAQQNATVICFKTLNQATKKYPCDILLSCLLFSTGGKVPHL